MQIVLITRDRPELTKQTIETMVSNAACWDNHALFVVFDQDLDDFIATNWPEELLSAGSPIYKGRCCAMGMTGVQLGVGGAKNHGARMIDELYEGAVDPGFHDDIIMFTDNDMYYLKDWDTRLVAALTDPPNHYIQMGGWKHPYHQAEILDGMGYNNETRSTVDAVTGNCFVMRWSDWVKYGPFDSNALGPGQSEDYALSQKIKADGGLVATLDPPVAIHCGLANCLGAPATGWAEMSAMAEQQMKDNDIDKIWLSTPYEGTIYLERNTTTHRKFQGVSSPGLREGQPTNKMGFSGLNVGSGQRRFDSAFGWTNIDCVSRPPAQVPDVVLDATRLVEHFGVNTQDMVVLHHVLEHFGCGEADEVLRQSYEVLKPGGSLLLFVPNMRKLAARWLGGEIDDYIFMVNTYGAYMGEEGDRHKWGFCWGNMIDCLIKALPSDKYPNWRLKEFDWREIPGADIARDWWVLGVEVVK